MEHRQYGQDFPGQPTRPVVFVKLERVYCVLDVIPWEGEELVKIFAEQSSAQQWAKDHATDALGLYEVRALAVDYS